MKKIVFLFMACTLAFMSGCKKDKDEEPQPQEEYVINEGPLVDICQQWGADSTTLYKAVGYEPLMRRNNLRLYLYYHTDGDKKGSLKQVTAYSLTEDGKLQYALVLAPQDTEGIEEYMAERFVKTMDYPVIPDLLSVPIYANNADPQKATTMGTYMLVPVPETMTEYYLLVNSLFGTNTCYIFVYTESQAFMPLMQQLLASFLTTAM